jgi:hypothetical protein
MRLYYNLFCTVYYLISSIDWAELDRSVEARGHSTIIFLTVVEFLNILTLKPKTFTTLEGVFIAIFVMSINHLIFLPKKRYKTILVDNSNKHPPLFLLSAIYLIASVILIVKADWPLVRTAD